MDWQTKEIRSAEKKEKEVKEVTPGYIRTELIDKQGDTLVITGGRQSRGECKQIVLHIPGEIIDKVDKYGFGTKSAVYLGLIEFGLKELEKQGKTLKVEVG